MYSILYITTILVVTCNCQDNWGLLQISRDRTLLIDCIESKDFFTVAKYTKDFSGIKYVIKKVAEVFHSRTVTREEITEPFSTIIIYSSLLKYKTLSWDQLKEHIKKALIDCSDNGNISRIWKDRCIDPSNHQTLPLFLDRQPVGLNILLDYLLVDWTSQDIFGTFENRATVRRFAGDVFNIFESFFTSLDVQVLDFNLRLSWNRRAQIFYDGRNSSLIPYLKHRYTMGYPIPYTLDDPNLFLNRRDESFWMRNPQASPSQRQRILDIYRRGPNGTVILNSNDFVQVYEKRGMTSADDYYQKLRIQNYRILLIFLELVENDALNGTDDYEVTEDLQELLRNDTAYRDYLIGRTRQVLDRTATDDDNNTRAYRRLLETQSRVHEEYLIALLLNTIFTNDNITTSTTRPEMLNATIISIFSTTPKPSGDDKYPEKRQREDFTSGGEYFDASERSIYPECYAGSNVKSGPSKQYFHHKIDWFSDETVTIMKQFSMLLKGCMG